jgi:hypothetical protein
VIPVLSIWGRRALHRPPILQPFRTFRQIEHPHSIRLLCCHAILPSLILRLSYLTRSVTSPHIRSNITISSIACFIHNHDLLLALGSCRVRSPKQSDIVRAANSPPHDFSTLRNLMVLVHLATETQESPERGWGLALGGMLSFVLLGGFQSGL